MNERKTVVLDTLRKIGDISFQRDVWVDHLYWDRILNFGEAVNTLDDYNFFEDESIRQKNPDLIAFFTKSLTTYKEDISNPSEILNDPNWLSIVDASKIIYALLENEEL